MSFRIPFRKNGIAEVYWNCKMQKIGGKILLVTKAKVLLQPSESMGCKARSYRGEATELDLDHSLP